MVGLLAAERDPARLFELARGRLEQARIPAPVRALRLLARELPPFVPAGRDLFEARPQQALPWEALRERLRARLGEDALYQLAPATPTLARSRRSRRSALLLREPPPLSLPARPAWLLARPLPLRDHRRACSPARSASSRAGGTAATCAATTTWSRPRRASAPGPSCAAGEREGAWMLHGWFA